MSLFDPVVAVQFTEAEQTFIGFVLLMSALLGAVGFLWHKFSYVAEPAVVSYFNVLATYERERAKFRLLRQTLRAESQRAVPIQSRDLGAETSVFSGSADRGGPSEAEVHGLDRRREQHGEAPRVTRGKGAA